MPHFHWHLLANTVIFLAAILLWPEIGMLPLVLLLLADTILDMDHLIKFRSIKKVFQSYDKCTDYPFHKVWIVLPVSIISFLTPAFWFGIGLLTHFSLDFVENHLLFKGEFRWV